MPFKLKLRFSSKPRQPKVRKLEIKRQKSKLFSKDPEQMIKCLRGIKFKRDRMVFDRIVKTNCMERKLSESPATRFRVTGIYGYVAYNVGYRMIGSRIFTNQKFTEMVKIGKS